MGDGDGERWAILAGGLRRSLYRHSVLLSPATFLTKICIVSSAAMDEAEEAEETEEMLLERMMALLMMAN